MSDNYYKNEAAGEDAPPAGSPVSEDVPIPARGRYEFPILGIDTDVRDRVTVRALFGFMQDAANLHAYALNLTPEVIKADGAWLLSRLSVSLSDRPVFPGSVFMETWSGGADGIRFLRGYRMINGDGRCFGEASSEWIVAERKQHRPLKPLDVFSKEKIKACTVEDPLTSGRLVRQEPSKAEPERTVHLPLDYSRIDRNLHVNNSVYAEMALDAIARSFIDPENLLRNGLSPVSIDIYFARELRYGGYVSLELSLEGAETYFIRGLNEAGETAYTARIVLSAGEELP